MTDVRIIKKYANRRLYDTTTNAYITLDDIKNLVIDKTAFKVIDAKNGNDITQNTLLQIIAEQEMGANPLFTADILQDFIRFYHENAHDRFRQSLEQMMRLFAQQRDMFSQQWQAYWDLFRGHDKTGKK